VGQKGTEPNQGPGLAGKETTQGSGNDVIDLSGALISRPGFSGQWSMVNHLHAMWKKPLTSVPNPRELGCLVELTTSFFRPPQDRPWFIDTDAKYDLKKSGTN
jgi:hypothetical protein